jgi:hypothetical protein
MTLQCHRKRRGFVGYLGKFMASEPKITPSLKRGALNEIRHHPGIQ